MSLSKVLKVHEQNGQKLVQKDWNQEILVQILWLQIVTNGCPYPYLFQYQSSMTLSYFLMSGEIFLKHLDFQGDKRMTCIAWSLIHA